jgi:hypothetical protein
MAQAAAYFTKLKEDKNVVELPDGLRYQILKPGAGDPPKPTDTVKVNYTGTLIDGTVFDSSERTGKPLEIQLNKVIPAGPRACRRSARAARSCSSCRRSWATATTAARASRRAPCSSSRSTCWTSRPRPAVTGPGPAK